MTPTSITVNPALLAPNPWNTNGMGPDAELKLEESIRQFGMFKPVIVRRLENGSLQIIGGEHRATIAKRMGMAEIPAVDLGRLSDQEAKKVGLLDNSRYGTDDTFLLAELLEGLGNAEDLAKYMPYSESDLASIFSSVNIALDDLDIPDDEDSLPITPREKTVQTHQVMRFKVPAEDAVRIQELVERTMKTHKFSESDALTNAGDALVHLLLRGVD
jgi:ParB family chromosome partitioning protein